MRCLVTWGTPRVAELQRAGRCQASLKIRQRRLVLSCAGALKGGRRPGRQQHVFSWQSVAGARAHTHTQTRTHARMHTHTHTRTHIHRTKEACRAATVAGTVVQSQSRRHSHAVAVTVTQAQLCSGRHSHAVAGTVMQWQAQSCRAASGRHSHAHPGYPQFEAA